MNTKPLGPFRGVNNLLPDTKLVTPEGAWLRSAVNVDIKPGGNIGRRRGFALTIAGAAAHSLWSSGSGMGYYADGSALYRVRPGDSGLARELVRDDLTPGPRLSYAQVRDWAYYSNGIERGILRDGSSSPDWGPLPNMLDERSPAYRWRPMPAGSIVRHYKGRLLVVRGTVLYISEPFAPNVYSPTRGYIAFSAPITLVMPLDSGLFVCADKTYWLTGDLSQGMDVALPYGAVAGTDAPTIDGKGWMWTSLRGVVRGNPDGSATNMQEKQLAISPGTAGAMLLREFDGMRKAVSAVSGIEASTAMAHSFMDAEIVRKGVIV